MSRLIKTLILAAVAALCLLPSIASAHEHREVGEYEFTVGFLNEPAYENEQNGIWVEVLNHDTEEPIEGLADTLNAEVIFGDQRREMELRPAWGEEGVYISNFYPTQAGDYTFRFYGEIEGTPVDESFTSSPDGFDSVKPVADLQFPVAVSSNAELSQQLTAAQNTARIAMIVGGAGLALGLLGLIVAGMALRGRRPATAMREPTTSRA
jgi:hypothetical protein